MRPDNEITPEELICELRLLRRQVAETKHVQEQLAEARQAYANLQKRFEVRARALERKCAERDKSIEALKRAQLIIDKSPVILFQRLANERGRLVYVSNNIIQFGYTPDDFIDEKIHYKDVVHSDDFERVGEEITAYEEMDVEEYTQTYRILTKDRQVRWIEDKTSVIRDEHGEKIHNQGMLIDITERKNAEDKLRKSEEKFRRIVETAGEGFLLMDQDLFIKDVNEAYCNMIGYSREEIIGKTPLDFAPDESREYLSTHKEKLLSTEYRTSESVVVARDGRHIPILVHGNTLRNDTGEIIGNMAFITDMTEHKKALALAEEVQKSLLPQSGRKIRGIDVVGKNVSCDEIGGDYFDFLWQQEYPDAYFSVIVGDITGHGVDAALLVTSARAFLRMRAAQSGTISQIVTEMNRHLTKDVFDSGRFMTLFYLAIEPERNQIEWVRAGHDPAYLYDPHKDHFEILKGEGIALGVDEHSSYPVNRKHGLTEGQIIAIGTDGIWEACNKEGEMFGKERFCAIIREKAHQGAGDILNAVYHALSLFTAGVKTADDITLVVLKITEPQWDVNECADGESHKIVQRSIV